MAGQRPEPFVAVNGKCARLSWYKCNGDRLAGTDILFNGESSCWVLDDEIVWDKRRHTGECQFNRLSSFDDQMVWGIRIAIECDRGSLHPICRHRDHDRRAGLGRFCCMNACHADRCQQADSREHVDQSHMHPIDEPFLTGRTGMGQLCPEVSGTSGALTLAFKELFPTTYRHHIRG